MNILFLGKPGSGKGVQSNLLVLTKQLIHVSTGDMLRQAYEKQTELGLKAQKFWFDGGYVPDDIMIPLMQEEISHFLAINKYLGDGYPRTIPQAKAFDESLKKLGTKLHAVILLRVSDEVCKQRLIHRSYCPECKLNYNITHKRFNAYKGKCKYCLGSLKKRSDDTPSRVDYRLGDVYVNLVTPLYDYYKEQGILHEVDGEKDPFEVHRNVRKIVDMSEM